MYKYKCVCLSLYIYIKSKNFQIIANENYTPPTNWPMLAQQTNFISQQNWNKCQKIKCGTILEYKVNESSKPN